MPAVDRRAFAVLVCFALTALTPAARGQAFTSVPSTEITIASAKLGTDRKIIVVTPMSFDSTARLPVLVLLDADDRQQFDAAVANIRFLAGRRTIRPMLIVGIPNGATRTKDLTPVSRSPTAMSGADPGGGADRFADFLTDEVLPTIRARYRTTGYTVLAGHSLGGLFVIHMAATRPGVFAAGIAMSPSLWWSDSTLVAPYAKAIAGTRTPLRLFVSNGGLEPIIDGVTRRFVTRLTSLPKPALAFRYRRYAEDAHTQTPMTSLTDGLRFIFEPVSLAAGPLALLSPTASSATIMAAYRATEHRYAGGARRIGVDTLLPEPFVRQVGLIALLGYRQPEAAVTILRGNVMRHSESATAYDNLGDALLAVHDTAGARAQYAKAVTIATGTPSPLLTALSEKLKKLAGSGPGME